MVACILCDLASDMFCALVPVALSIVHITASLRQHFVKYMLSTISNTSYKNLLHLQNILTFFKNKQTKQQDIKFCNIFVLDFNKSLTNDVDNFEQLSPVVYLLYATHSFNIC